MLQVKIERCRVVIFNYVEQKMTQSAANQRTTAIIEMCKVAIDSK